MKDSGVRKSQEESGRVRKARHGFPRLLPIPPDSSRLERGFTLLELLVVMTIIGILAAIAVPSLRDSPKRAREATLRADLFTFRSVIDQYKGDKGNFPVDLQTLVKENYMRKIPLDPMTKASDWVITQEEEATSPDDPTQLATPGIIDVHSASKDKALDGTNYSEW